MKKTLLVTLLIAAFALIFAGCNAEDILSDVGVKKDAGTKDTGPCTPSCDGKACGDDDGCGTQCVGSCPEGKTCNPNTYTCENTSTCTEGSKQCSGTKVQTCTNGAWVNGEDCAASGKTCDNGECKTHQSCTEGSKQCIGTKVQTCTNGVWVDGEDCAASGKTCQNGACVCTPNCTGKFCGDDDGCGGKCKACQNANETCNTTTWKCEPSTCVPTEGAPCNIDTKPCCEGFSCVTIGQDQKDSKCYKDCTNDQNVCSSTQQCIGWMQGSAACFEVTTIANGTFSKCLSYKDGEQPGQNDQMGTASIKATIGGISYNFTVCAGDYQVVDQSGNYWLVETYDVSKLQTKKIVYLFNIFVDEAEHTVGTHTIGEKIQPLIYELSLDANYNTTKAILHSMGIQGDLNFSAVGTGSKAPTTGTISNVLMMGYDYVICDNAAGNPCQ